MGICEEQGGPLAGVTMLLGLSGAHPYGFFAGSWFNPRHNRPKPSLSGPTHQSWNPWSPLCSTKYHKATDPNSPSHNSVGHQSEVKVKAGLAQPGSWPTLCAGNSSILWLFYCKTANRHLLFSFFLEFSFPEYTFKEQGVVSKWIHPYLATLVHSFSWYKAIECIVSTLSHWSIRFQGV